MCGVREWSVKQGGMKVQIVGSRRCKNHLPYLRFESAGGEYLGAIDGIQSLRALAEAILRAIPKRRAPGGDAASKEGG